MKLNETKSKRFGASLMMRTCIGAVVTMGALAAGCASDSNETSGDASDAGVVGGRPSEQQCLRKDDLTTVLAPQVLGGGATITQLVANASHAYFSVGTSLYRVPAEGGPAEEIFADAESFSLSFSLESERLLIATDTAIVEVPLRGGEPQRLAELPETPTSDLFTGVAALVFDAQRAFFAGSNSSGQQVALYAVALDSGQVTELGSASDSILSLARVGDALYWSERSSEPSAPYANKLMRLPVAGGAAEEVSVDLGPLHLSFALLGAAADGVLLDVSLDLNADNSDNSAVTASGVYRQPVSGGRATQLLETAALDLTDLFGVVSSRQAVQAGNELFLRTGSFQSAEVYSLAAGEELPKKRFCLTLGQSGVGAMTVANGAVYFALSTDDESLILRRDL